MKTLIICCLIFVNLSYAFEYRAYDIGGNEIAAKSVIKIKGEEYTLLPFSTLDLKKDEINLDGDFILLFAKINGKKIEPIKLASNYKSQTIVVKIFKSSNKFDDSTFITKSEEIYIDADLVFFSIDLKD